MVSLDILLIFTVLFCSGILSETQAITTEEAAADDDDEIALEDYVDNELPNFSGDVSSALLGDTTGYDVHIEVKIANRSKTKGNKDENIELSDTSTTSTVSPKNRMKAKKILDLIIEKLKHKKDAKEKIDDTTDVEIEDDGEKVIKAKDKHTKSPHTKTDESSNEDLGENTAGSKGDIVDSIEKNTDNKGSHLPLKDQDMAPSFKKKDENIASTLKVKEHKAFSFKTKEPDIDPRVKPKDQEMHLPTKKKDELKNQHTFNLPPAGKPDMKEESFSFKDSNPQHMPKTSALPEYDSSQAKNSKPIGKSGENWEGSKYIKIKVSGDEIRIKVPEFLNKTALFSRIIDIIEEDGKKVSRYVKTKSGSVNDARQSLNAITSKLGNNTPPFYKFLLLKKLHKNAGKITQSQPEQVTTDQHLPDAVSNVDDTSSKRITALPKENINEIDEVSTAKVNSVKEKEADNVDEITVKKKETTNFEHQEEVSEKKVVSGSNPNKEDSSEQNAFLQGGSMEEKEDLSEKVKLHDNKEEAIEKEKLHEEKALAIENEFNEKVEGNKNEAFVPNNFASKSFQENLEPVEMGNKPNDNSNIKAPDKKVLDIVPDELHIEDADTSEKEMNVPPKQADIKPSIGRNHKLESTNSNSIMSGMKHVETHGPKLNPGRLFNDSLFQQAGMESSDNIEGKHKIEAPYTMTSNNGEINHHAKLIADKKSDKGSHPIIDVLTFPEFSRDKSHDMLSAKSHSMLEEKFEKIHNMEENKHKSHIADDKHERMHEMMEDKHEKLPHNTRKEKLGKTHNTADDSHEKVDSMLLDKDEKPEPIATEKFKPLNNPLPSILFKEILNTDDSVSKLSRKNKHTKKPGREILIDDEKPSEKKEKFTEKENDDVEEDKIKITPEHIHKSVSTTRSRESTSKGGNKLDLSDLASLQLQSKDNLEIGGDEDEEGTGEDDEYEDASGDDDDIAEMKDGTDTSNLSIANLAIWKASEDIHALLHSLTDREHADKVLGNLRNFIRNKHSVEARKRNSFDRISNARKGKSLHLPDPKTKSFVMGNNLIPQYVDLKRKSRIPKRPRGSKRNLIHFPKSYLKGDKKKRRVIEYDKYTNHTGQGLDRLYNQIATANALIPPTFADDQEGWSSDEVTNVMSQLKTTDIDDDMPGGNADSVLNPAFQDIGIAAFTGTRSHHIGLPQNGEHAAESLPMKELIGYQKELRNQMLQNKLLHNKNEILTKSPVIPEFRKDKVSQVNTRSATRKSLSAKNDKVAIDNPVSSVQSQLNIPYNNSSVQFGNGDYIEGSPEYNLNKDNLWWNRNYKRNSIHGNVTT